jgi:GH35 family endo-1,4-beta-xylanase
MTQSKIIFKPVFTQKGPGPHLHNFVLTQDEQNDVFYSDVRIESDGIVITNLMGKKKFSISVRWNVEGFGYLFMPADNEGEFYELPQGGTKTLNLSYELAKTRIHKNKSRIDSFRDCGYVPSFELQKMIDIGNHFLDEAKKIIHDEYLCAGFAQQSLKYSLEASEMIEIEKARYDITKNGARPDFLFGCDTRGYFKMEKDLFFERFTELFNFATITHYLKGDIIDFEPEEGKKHFKERDEMLDMLLEKNVTVLGRPLFWSHNWVTPEWLKNKSFTDLKKYLKNHIKEVIGHYGNKIKVWEVVNEMHDWANELSLDQKQLIELSKLACDVARDTNPEIKLLINNCCPFAEYVQLRKWGQRDAKFPQRTPHQFTRDLLDAGADFDLIGAQVYFVHRTIAETVSFIERYSEFGKQMHLAEIGSPSKGITLEFWEDDLDWSTQPYEWHRHWDEELQADWLEKIFTIGYSKPYIQAANWYDFADPIGFLKSGGILRSVNGEKKAACDRLLELKHKWNNLK